FTACVGTMLGLSLVLLSPIGYVLNMQESSVLGILNYVVMAVLVFFGSKNLRDKYSDGYIKYSRALGSSFLIGFFGGILLAFYIYVFMKYIDPSILEQMKILTEQKLIEKGLPESQIEMSMKMISPGMITFGTIFTFSFWSFLLALIIAFFIRKENKTSIEGGETTV
ncbi:MAG: DUF4199 domain-containing protein, partial [Bacteroidales bacterium]|nr:DUF4199 domain-containing protein [Bacteroidales bacterium]